MVKDVVRATARYHQFVPAKYRQLIVKSGLLLNRFRAKDLRLNAFTLA